MNMAASTKQQKSYRAVFIDQTRTIAILLMLLGHSLDSFLGEPWRSGPVYQNYQFVRGISSTLFLTVAGFSFVIASFKHYGEYTRFSPRMFGRIRRILLIVFLGYTLNIWAPTLTQSIRTFSDANLERILRYDVLQNIAFGLAALHLLMWFAGDPRKFLRWVIPAAVVVFSLAALTYRPDVDAALPGPIQAMGNLYHQSRFPVVPYTGFLLVGATFGYFFWRARQNGGENKVFIGALIAAALLIGFEVVIRHGIEGGVFPYSAPMDWMPGNTFARTGCALIIITGFYYLGKVRLFLAKPCLIFSKDALLVYFVHLFLVYTATTFHEIIGFTKASMSPLHVWAFIIGLTAAMGALAWISGNLRTNRPELHAAIRQSLILGGSISFFCMPYAWWPLIGVSLLVGTTLVVIYHRHRARRVRASADGAA